MAANQVTGRPIPALKPLAANPAAKISRFLRVSSSKNPRGHAINGAPIAQPV
jgi:hypothetical protein